MSYEAIICKANVREHPNADALALATVSGFQVVVGIDTEPDQIGVFFGADGQLSEAYAEANDLIGYRDEDTGEKKGGYFSKNRRVRAQSFRGEKSEGYFAPLDSLAFTGYDLSKLSVGDKFDQLNDVPICNKYFTPATLRAMKNGQKTSLKRENKCFAKHIDTAQLRHEIGNIKDGSVLYITEKVHGTSFRFGYVPVETPVKRKWYQRALRRPVQFTSQYGHLNGTRNVIMADRTHEGYYGNEEFRWETIKQLENNLHKGEVVYGELVGYTSTGQPIMSPQKVEDLKAIKKQYGSTMLYKYGCPEGTTDAYIYRITRVNEDGIITELSWPETKQRASELGFKTVPELSGPFIYVGAPLLEGLVGELEQGASTIDSSHIREGVVIRIEGPDGKTNFCKSKSFEFKVLEGIVKNSDDYIDTEEAS